MNKREVLEVYDRSYAQRYNQTFLENPDNKFLEKSLFEIEILKRLTGQAESWLDVACGTGYFLRRARGNSVIRCAGLDISHAMLAEARAANPDAHFVEADFLQPQPGFDGRWDVTSCMWGAYGLQENVRNIETLVENLATWTRSGGACFVPVFDLALFIDQQERGVLMKGVEIDLNRDCWSFVEPDGKTHRDVLAPPVPIMEAIFKNYFESIETFPYPSGKDGIPMAGIIARRAGGLL